MSPLGYQPTWQTGIPEDILATGSARVLTAGQEAYSPVVGVQAQTAAVRRLPSRQYIPSIQGGAAPAAPPAGQQLSAALAGFDPFAMIGEWWAGQEAALTAQYGTPAFVGGELQMGAVQENIGTTLPVTQAGLPLVAGAAALIGGVSKGATLGVFRGILTKFGPTVLKGIVGGAAFGWIMSLIMGDDPDDKLINLKKKRRYTIGSNPRVRTLQKVSRHCQRLLKRHEKVIREFLPKKQPRYGIPPARALSAIEKAAIRA